jgi:hypothetical protein
MVPRPGAAGIDAAQEDDGPANGSRSGVDLGCVGVGTEVVLLKHRGGQQIGLDGEWADERDFARPGNAALDDASADRVIRGFSALRRRRRRRIARMTPHDLRQRQDCTEREDQSPGAIHGIIPSGRLLAAVRTASARNPERT